MRNKTFEIYFSDLTPAARQEFLDRIGETDIKIPTTTLCPSPLCLSPNLSFRR